MYKISVEMYPVNELSFSFAPIIKRLNRFHQPGERFVERRIFICCLLGIG